MNRIRRVLCCVLIISTMLCLFPICNTVAAETIPEDAVEWNGHYYQLFDDGISWENARIACSQMGGHLVTITSAEEQAFVLSLMGEAKLNVYWLGCRLNYDWAWVTGEEFSFSNWGNGEPNNEDGEEAYVQMYAKSFRQKIPGDWNDASNVGAEYSADFYRLENTGYICEWDMLDSDGDGLYDHWEIHGIDTDGDGNPDLMLNEMGADPNVRDIFVEVDWMVRPKKSFLFWTVRNARSMLPSERALQMVYEAFKAQNINIHIDAGPESIDFVTGKAWGSLSGGNEIGYVYSFDTNNWENVVAENFTAGREIAFKHCIFADTYNNGSSSGIADGIPGQCFIVANQDWVFEGGDISIAGTFMHELGHTLGLMHGGCDHIHYKPNYLSIMNYLFQTTGLHSAGGGVLDYSDYLLPDIDEGNINEENGIDPGNALNNSNLGTSWYINGRLATIAQAAGAAIDFDENGNIDQSISIDLNCDGSISTLRGNTSDWDSIIFAGGRVGDMTALGKDIKIPNNEVEEKTLEESIITNTLGSIGDGYADCMNVMFRSNIGGQQLYVKITNRSAEATTYQLKAECTELMENMTTEVLVEGSNESLSSVVIACPLKSNLQAGLYMVTLTLSSEAGLERVFKYTIEVVDPSNEELVELQQLIASGELDAMNLENEVYQQMIFAATSEKFKGYQIDFNANGGSGSMDTVTGFMGGTFSLPTCEFFARDGKTFAGWALTPSAEPIEGESWEIDGDTTFYAIWKDVESKEQKVPEKTDDVAWVLYAGICAFAVSFIAVIIVWFHYRKSRKSKK